MPSSLSSLLLPLHRFASSSTSSQYLLKLFPFYYSVPFPCIITITFHSHLHPRFLFASLLSLSTFSPSPRFHCKFSGGHSSSDLFSLTSIRLGLPFLTNPSSNFEAVYLTISHRLSLFLSEYCAYSLSVI